MEVYLLLVRGTARQFSEMIGTGMSRSLVIVQCIFSESPHCRIREY